MSVERPGVTRRAVLHGAAVAGAAALLEPAGGLAAGGLARGRPGGVPDGVFSRYVGTLTGESLALRAPGRFALVGVEWRSPAWAGIDLRTRLGAGGSWSPWASASVQGHGPDRPARRDGGRFGEPIWIGVGDQVQLRSSGAPYTAFAPGSRVSLPRIAGHRDGDQTSCPGDALYARLPMVRPQVARLVGTPARLTIAAQVAPVSAGTPVNVTGRLADLASGAPLAGAPLEIQQITGTDTETTLATVTTDANGSWSYPATPAQNTLLRALHRPAPAAVSDIVVLAVAPVLSLTLDSAAPPTVSGTVTPAGSRVTIDLYRITSSGSRQLVAAKQVAAVGGSFQARIKRPHPGRYVLVARTAASARYAAGASPAVQLAV